MSHQISSIVQLPAIARAGAIEMMSADLLKLDKSELDKIAMVMGGELIYVKLRAIYTELETAMCSFNNCYRPVGHSDMWCSDHVDGKDRSRNNASLVNPRP